jgi:hypothetical protein
MTPAQSNPQFVVRVATIPGRPDRGRAYPMDRPTSVSSPGPLRRTCTGRGVFSLLASRPFSNSRMSLAAISPKSAQLSFAAVNLTSVSPCVFLAGIKPSGRAFAHEQENV